MTAAQILIIDDVHQSLVQKLQAAGHQVDYKPTATAAEVPKLLPHYTGLVLRSKLKLTEELLRLAPNLRFIARAGAGVDAIAESYLQENNITLLNAPEGNRNAVGEHAVGMLLSLLHKLHLGNAQVQQLKWDREDNRGIELASQTVGILGYGNMGKAFAKRLSGFGCKVLAYDRYRNNLGDANAQQVPLEQLQAEATVISLHFPLTEANRGWVNYQLLSQFKHPLYLINTGRGEVLPLADLVQCLNEGKVVAAGLDVLENEKLHTLTSQQKQHMQQLISSQRVLFTPHVAGWTVESYKRISNVLAEKIVRLLA
jgi:D-3-phosphoglycerate dehydrogenase